MSPLARSLLALAATALLHQACAAPQVDDSQCKSVMHGFSQGEGHELPVISIIAGVQDLSVEEISNPCTTVVGEEVVVCDDVAATIYVPDLPLISPVVVHRNGNYFAGPARVYVTLWCEYQ